MKMAKVTSFFCPECLLKLGAMAEVAGPSCHCDPGKFVTYLQAVVSAGSIRGNVASSKCTLSSGVNTALAAVSAALC